MKKRILELLNKLFVAVFTDLARSSMQIWKCTMICCSTTTACDILRVTWDQADGIKQPAINRDRARRVAVPVIGTACASSVTCSFTSVALTYILI